jgi:hypothetical protein
MAISGVGSSIRPLIPSQDSSATDPLWDFFGHDPFNGISSATHSPPHIDPFMGLFPSTLLSVPDTCAPNAAP